jgi:hypothetical protein
MENVQLEFHISFFYTRSYSVYHLHVELEKGAVKLWVSFWQFVPKELIKLFWITSVTHIVLRNMRKKVLSPEF